ncbi:phBC6A51 family helix-turn-helix protein [Lysinibacillus antri]|uniref:Homeodomain phBC6A51-type domain-containing protein n=1 Tax=Lysinibacillus antri TaxID=2498145 RepID=A0A432LA83_9BACI|nr:phBC6A51 family helix-turn-helix protein [Lysinibacillus antri]RUL51098.1 hypothetical protein EK386_12885 [Lysinibacillus antri]
MARKLDEILEDLTPDQVKAAHLLFENDIMEPKNRRSYDAIATELGVDVRTLYNWRQLDAMLEYKVVMTDMYTKEHRARIMRAVVREAELGNASMAKLFMQNQSMLVDRSEIEVKSEKVDESEVMAKLQSIKSRY